MLKEKEYILTDEDYRCLVRGDMLRLIDTDSYTRVTLMLSSQVSFRLMYAAINRAEDKKEQVGVNIEKTI